MSENAKSAKIPLIFYRSLGGGEPVREWLRRMSEADRRAIGKDLLRAQWRWPVGMPLCRPMGVGAVGDQNGPAVETHGSRAYLLSSGTLGGIARVHQEIAGDAG